ncbi:MAG TPA: hypothetical protein VFZ12_03495 [Dehalococcoidia bacterium]|nr:hypothetical protein [Dehalococcoidia bacterium]
MERTHWRLVVVPAWALLLLSLAALLVGCGDDDGATETDEADAQSTQVSFAGSRGFAMGFGHVQSERSIAGYEEPFRLAGEHGELILLQRGPAWSSFLPGALPEDSLTETTRTDLRLAEQHQVEFYLAVDPTDPTDRGRLFSPPSELAGLDFRDQVVQDAYLGYVEYLAEQYEPRYLALAVEVNLMARQNRPNYDAFLGVYESAYAAVKRVSPSTGVFVTLQFEALNGLPPSGETGMVGWQILDDFRSLDLVGISTYPGFSFGSIEEIPANYYDEVLNHTDLPIAIAEMGLNSQQQTPISSTEEDQREFLARLLADMDRLGFVFGIWYAPADPSYELPAPFNSLAFIGLLRSDGSEKPAWAEWVTVSGLDYDAPESAVAGQAPGPDGTPEPGTSATTPTPAEAP